MATLQALLDGAPVVVTGLDLEGRVRLWNREAERLFGWTAEEVLGAPYPLVPSSATSEHHTLLRRALGGERIAAHRTRRARKDGTLIDVALWTAPLRDAAGTVVGSLGILTDESERRRVPDSLRESQRRLRGFFDRLPVGLYRTTTHGRIVAANRALVAMLHYPTADALLGTNAEALHVDPAARARWLGRMRTDGTVRHCEIALRRYDGTTIWVEDTATAVPTGDGVEYEGSLIDVSERKHAQAELRQLAAAVDAASEGISMTDAEGRFLYVNRATARMHGYDGPETLHGKPWRVLYGPDELRRFDEVILPAFAESGEWSGRVTGLRQDGATFPQEISLTALEGGGLICVDRDVSERERLEAELRQAQKVDALGQLTSGIAHDFNNLLTIIQANADLVPEAGHDELGDVVSDLRAATQRGIQLVRKLLAFSRREALRPEPIQLDGVLQDLVSLLRRLLPETITLRLHVDGAVSPVLADPSAVEHMVVNLVTNARDAMPEGGTIEIGLRAAVVVPGDDHGANGGLAPGAYLCLSITDTGAGMAPDIVRRVFEPFFTTKPRGQGTGLGLAMVHGLMQQHHGTVRIDSEVGRGTRVSLYFPALAEGADTRPARQPAQRPAGGDETVLLAEDDANLRRTAQRVLERFGYRVLTAADGVEALERFDEVEGSVHVVVTDTVMPRMGGIDLWKELTRRGTTCPTVFTSGYAPERISREVRLDATTHFLEKPWSMLDLVREVRAVLDAAE